MWYLIFSRGANPLYPRLENNQESVTTRYIRIRKVYLWEIADFHLMCKSTTLRINAFELGKSICFQVPTRQYLDQTVVPVLLQALGGLSVFTSTEWFRFKKISSNILGALAKERPENPIEYVAQYLMKEKDRYVPPNQAQQQQQQQWTWAFIPRDLHLSSSRLI